jgi:hypothetical protein
MVDVDFDVTYQLVTRWVVIVRLKKKKNGCTVGQYVYG